MILETVRSLADALATTGNSYSVNTLLPLVLRDATDSEPPAITVFADETRDPEVALRRTSNLANRPALLLTIPRDVEFNGDLSSDVRDGTVTVLMTLVYDNADTPEAKTDLLYTVRAIQSAVREYVNNTNEAVRTRNGIQIIACTGMNVAGIFAPLEDGSVSVDITVTFLVRDTIP